MSMDRNPYGPFSADPAIMESLIRVIVAEVVKVLAERNMLALPSSSQVNGAPFQAGSQTAKGGADQIVGNGAAWSPSPQVSGKGAAWSPSPRQGFIVNGASRTGAAGNQTGYTGSQSAAPQVSAAVLEVKGLVTESTVIDAFRGGVKILKLAPRTIVTPLAKDIAREKGITLESGFGV
ncbi:MAG: hypothetical protein CVV64_18000 [Candidatus Wallbacteria bacterium HGW-Wallbacteria-1]|jgi:hypothetical protein|uniref:Uncharacterized protein n=1 Tax=Candidatus Wallbacteria bacterium HGW-Wallbacteria-1 TaxID=2013854 RepID=A0A2N1PJW3_9BACT|nr:MAG: hypothetical protein CVV64_18000 [Candidatus Wallbacteria bacterium HGW-Wallbacteria-1]